MPVTIRLSEEEHDRITEAAERDGAVYYGGDGRPSLSGWIREAALEKAKACGARAIVGQ